MIGYVRTETCTQQIAAITQQASGSFDHLCLVGSSTFHVQYTGEEVTEDLMSGS